MTTRTTAVHLGLCLVLAAPWIAFAGGETKGRGQDKSRSTSTSQPNLLLPETIGSEMKSSGALSDDQKEGIRRFVHGKRIGMRHCFEKHTTQRRGQVAGKVVLAFMISASGRLTGFQASNTLGIRGLDSCFAEVFQGAILNGMPPTALEITYPLVMCGHGVDRE